MFPESDLLTGGPPGRYVCAQCGRPGSPDPGVTLMDSRYATGTCSGSHVGPQHLIREDLYGTTTEKKRKTTRR